MAALLEPGAGQSAELICYLKYAPQVLEEETLKQVRTNLALVKTNRAKCEALANVYQAGVEKIATLLHMVLQWREGPSIVEPIEEVESLSWLLLSLAEIERCMQSGGCYILSCAELLDSDVGNISVSRMISSLVREFSFSLDLVQAAFSVLVCEHKRHQQDGLENSSEWRGLATALLVYCRPSEYFEWCERRCRPVLKQCILDLGQAIWKFSPLVGESAYNDQGHLDHPGNICKPDPASVLEVLSVQPGYSLPLRIDHREVQYRNYLEHGSFGTVYNCKWHDKETVVKMILMDPEDWELYSERAFEREVSISASLRHPNAVQTFGFGYTEGRAQGFYVMEKMQTNLRTIIRERIEKRRLSGESLMFPIDVSMDIISQIVEGLCALKVQRVIHRDLKPANILVNRLDESTKPFDCFYRVKLADFGTAKVRDVGHSVFSTLRVGTVEYMAPEVMATTLLPEGSGEHGYSWKADVYSFGLVCSEILTGLVPFRKYEAQVGMTLAAVRGGERPELPLDAGDPLRRLIEDCWKLNSEERPDVWEVRERLWECRAFQFFMMEKPSTSWQSFCFRLDSRRANINRSEISSGVGASSPISGNKEREQASDSSGELQVTELMQNVINIARSTRGCTPVCTKVADVLSWIKKRMELIMKYLTISQNERLCFADVERLWICITELGESLRALTSILRGVGVGLHRLHRCIRNSNATISEVVCLYVKVTELSVSRQGLVVMPTRAQVSAAMHRIHFDPHNVHIAVCGTSGSGISSFVNAFCGLRDYLAAKVGVTQCTSDITRYRKELPSLDGPFLPGSLWIYDFPGAGTMSSPEEHYFYGQGLFLFDALVLVYDARFSRSDMEIFKASLRFNVPVFIVRSKADQHIANMIRVETGVERGDKDSYNKVYQEMVEKYVEATQSEFKRLMADMETDLETDLRDQELLLKQPVYIHSSISSKPESSSLPESEGSRNKFIDKHSFDADFRACLPPIIPRLVLVSDCHKWCQTLFMIDSES